jgi:hypothetical protein
VKRKLRARHLTIVSAKMPLDSPRAPQTPMDFFERPILNSPYAYPGQHWELEGGLPTNRVIANRRRAELLSPIPKAKKQKAKRGTQSAIEFDDKTGLEIDAQKYDVAIINELAGACAGFVALSDRYYPTWREARLDLNALTVGAEVWREQAPMG